MYKKKSLFITFEGIEGSGKSYQSKKLFDKVKKMGLPVLYTREPGGSEGAEKIRRIILSGSKSKFTDSTDTLLYLASRNEHIEKRLKSSIIQKKIIICDRFSDSTNAYQIYGKGINKSLVDAVHKIILRGIKPDLTFVLTVNVNIALQRINKRKSKNRYDKFTKKFYQKVQNGFIKLSKLNKKRYVLIDTSTDILETENLIFKRFINTLKK